MTDTVARPTVAVHPLEPLTAEEIAVAVDLAKTAVGDQEPYISFVTLAEPAKDVVKAYREGDAVDRSALVVLSTGAGAGVTEVTVSITRGELVGLTEVPDAYLPFMFDEAIGASAKLKKHPDYVAALTARGITDFSNIQIDPWIPGNFGDEFAEHGRRYARCVSYWREFPDDNGYAYPIENLVAIVDLDTGDLVELIDTGVVPMPTDHGNYTTEAAIERGQQLRTPAALDIVQPDGPGFTVDGSLLRWERWSMRVSIHPIEGMVLHQITWHDDDRERPILYRAGLSEMVVPYGSTQTNHWWKNAFDAGEIGLGKCLNSLELGCDCLGEIRYLDGIMTGRDGKTMAMPNQICLHEEDVGILWKHTDHVTQEVEVRRSRRFVVSTIATVGNYEYAFYWYFYLDGTIEHEIKMTGILQSESIVDGQTLVQATKIAPNLAAPHHQHLFCFRLDWELDGSNNRVSEIDVEALPADQNPWGNAFDTVKTVFETESQAQRISDPARSRTWVVENPSVENGLGEPVGYKLQPGYGPTMLAAPSASVHARATFGTKHLWVTPFEPTEMHAAGDYPSQHPGGDGLPKWTAADRSIVDTDVVMWHTVGATHVARPEDWPVMPVESLGFKLKPYGFFDRNPALDLAPPANHCCD